MTQSKLPTYAALVADSSNLQAAYKNDLWNSLLNQAPHESWIKKHPLVTVKNDRGDLVPLRYLPVDKVEFLLTRIYQKWRVEIKSVEQIFNAVVVTVRLHVLNPTDQGWEYQDGVGATNVQVNKGEDASNLSAIKAAAVQMAAPSAESYAIKDAAEKFGAIFGKDLNRRDIVYFQPGYLNSPEAQVMFNGSPIKTETNPTPTFSTPTANSNSSLFNPNDL